MDFIRVRVYGIIAGSANAAPVYSANGDVGSKAEFGNRPGSLVAVAAALVWATANSVRKPARTLRRKECETARDGEGEERHGACAYIVGGLPALRQQIGGCLQDYGNSDVAE